MEPTMDGALSVHIPTQGRSQTFSFGGATGGARQNFGGAVAPPGTPLAPPLLIVVEPNVRMLMRLLHSSN